MLRHVSHGRAIRLASPAAAFGISPVCYVQGLKGTIFAVLVHAAFLSVTLGAVIAPPPSGKLYHGFYWGGVGTDTHDPTEHDVTPADVERYEQAVGAQITWVYFSDNWFESREFPRAMCDWIRQSGKIPYIRLMLRSDVDQNHSEKRFTLERIVRGDFDADLERWGTEAKKYGGPFLIEWGTEPNGEWFSWNGKWHGRGTTAAALYVRAWRHIVDRIRRSGADNLTWVWHANWWDEPETKWNRLENYYPGDDYCDWIAVSVYGPITPRAKEGLESFRAKMDQVFPRLTNLSQKPILLAEFGCDIHNPRLNAADWAKSALDDLFSKRWPRLIGFCWWNEGWQNDNVKKHDSDLIITHDPDLTKVFRQELANHRAQIQESAVTK